MDDLTIKDLRVFEYALPFKAPCRLKNKTISSREGLLVRITLKNNQQGWGEIAPLPGFSDETLAQAKVQIISLKKEILGISLERLRDPHTLFEHSSQDLYPSVVFGLESAALNAVSEIQQEPVYKILGYSTLKSIPIIALLPTDPKEALKFVEDSLKSGFKAFKMKVYNGISAGEMETIQKISILLGDRATLRLDANQSFSLAESIDFFRRLNKIKLEYIEEPFADPLKDLSQITHFEVITKYPVALDESIVGIKPNTFKAVQGTKALILKPSLLGGIKKTMEWIQKGKTYGLNVVISSSFESSVGLLTLAHLGVHNDCHPIGIDTLRSFKSDVLKQSLQFPRGELMLPQYPFRPENINLNLLKAVV